MTGKGVRWRSGRIVLLGPVVLAAVAVASREAVVVVLEAAAALELVAALGVEEEDLVAAMGEGVGEVLPVPVAALVGVDTVAATTLLSRPTTSRTMRPAEVNAAP
jgi:hypothetical protein